MAPERTSRQLLLVSGSYLGGCAQSGREYVEMHGLDVVRAVGAAMEVASGLDLAAAYERADLK
jgi:hypothetical protein